MLQCKHNWNSESRSSAKCDCRMCSKVGLQASNMPTVKCFGHLGSRVRWMGAFSFPTCWFISWPHWFWIWEICIGNRPFKGNCLLKSCRVWLFAFAVTKCSFPHRHLSFCSWCALKQIHQNALFAGHIHFSNATYMQVKKLRTKRFQYRYRWENE